MIILYIIAIFNFPIVANNIEKTIWLNWFNQKIRDFKETFDHTYTNIPTTEQFKETYNNTVNSAWNITKDAVWSVNDFKNSVDEIRWTLSWAVNTYKEVKTTIDETKTQVENWVNALKTTADTINWVWFSIQNTMSWTLNNN